MKKKKVLLLLAAIILTGTTIYWLWKPLVVKKEVAIISSPEKILNLLEKDTAYTKWFFGFDTNFPEKEIPTIVTSDILKTIIRFPSDSSRHIVYKVLPDLQSGKTNVQLLYKSNRISQLIGTNKLHKTADNSIDFLKQYLESSILSYGIDVKRITVTDTLFIVLTKKIKKEDFKMATSAAYNELINYANQKQLGLTGTKIFHRKEIDTNTYEIFAGIGISKKIFTGLTDDIQLMMMPKGNLLQVQYEGPYYGLQDKYNRIGQFAKEKGYNTMALPFEKWLIPEIAVEDSQYIKAEINYPVY